MRYIIILLLGGLSLTTWSQSCIPDYIDFYTQGQIDSFQINYPNCTEIEGDVDIGGSITNLNGLLILSSIGGSLEIEWTSSLTSLYGLNNLTSVGGRVIIYKNSSLINLVGLNSLVSIGEYFDIRQNVSLTSLTGLENLTSIGGNFNIGCSGYSFTGNPLLNDISSLSSLSSIGGTLQICNNFSLTDLSGLENLTEVESISIYSNDNLTSITGLQGLTDISDGISIGWNDSLYNLNGLNNLVSVGEITISRNHNLNSLNGLESISSIGGDFYIFDNLITNIEALANLALVGGNLTIDHNSALLSLTGLENLTETGGDLILLGNGSLTSLSALSGLISVGGDLIIAGNDISSLTPLSGLNSIGGILQISGNGNLTSLSGIDNINAASIQGLCINQEWNLSDCAFENICEYLANPNGVVDIYWNAYPCDSPSQIANECGITLPCLPHGNYYFFYQSDIDSFQINYPGCTDLNGSVHIWGGWGGGSGDFTNLNGLSVITSINGTLSVANAYLLASLSGVDNIAAGSISELYIIGNSSLSTCEVQSVCDYIANPNGILEISDNGPGCNNPEEVQEACETISIPEHGFEPLIKVYPIPANQRLYIENKSGYEPKELKIFNSFGQIVISPNFNGQFLDVSSLNSGVYILELIFNEHISRVNFLINN